MSGEQSEDDQMSIARKSLPSHAARMAAALALFGFTGVVLGASAGAAKAEPYPSYDRPHALYAPYRPYRAYTGYFFATNFCRPDENNVDGGFAAPAYDGGVFVGYVCR